MATKEFEHLRLQTSFQRLYPNANICHARGCWAPAYYGFVGADYCKVHGEHEKMGGRPVLATYAEPPNPWRCPRCAIVLACGPVEGLNVPTALTCDNCGVMAVRE